jgi:RimJ/RimL family protein N-acetyltransferase
MGDQPFPESLCHRFAEKYPRQPVLACPLYRPAVLTTERLLLREATPADEPFVATMTDSLFGMAPHEWIARVGERYARDGYALWLAIERATGAPIGWIGLLAQTIDGVDEAEVSYHLHAQQRGRGFAIEGARAVRDWAFARGYDHVIALVREENIASQAVARKLGMTPRGRAMHAGSEHVVWRMDR